MAKLIKKTRQPASLPPVEKPKSLATALARGGTAFVSTPPTLLDAAGLKAMGKTFPTWRLRFFADVFGEQPEQWKTNLARFLAPIDALILVIDAERRLTPGQMRELRQAQKLRKLVIVFNLATGRWEMVARLQPNPAGPGALLEEMPARPVASKRAEQAKPAAKLQRAA